MKQLCCLLGVSLLLVACAGQRPEEADGRPLADIAPAQVVDALPRPDPILAAGNTSPYEVGGEEYRVLASSAGYRENGIASWYGRKFHGRNTANGEVFDTYAATAAHRTLPLPSYVRVTNLENHESLVVRVNDRGPFHADRIIDLSYGAAVKLGFAEQGTARVELVAISVEGIEDLRNDPALAHWKVDYRYLQVASLADKRSAHVLQQRLASSLSTPVQISAFTRKRSTWYRVRVGPFHDRQRLLTAQQQLLVQGYEGVRPVPE